MGTDTIGRLDIELSANTAEFIEAFREAADSVRHSKEEITGNFRAIKLASAELDAQLATGGISGSAALTARRNIISLAQQEIDLAKKEGIEHGRNLGYLKAATAEIEKQKNALAGGGQFKGAAADILNAVKLRAANIPGLGGFGNVLAIRAYEPVGKMLEEGAGNLEEKFGGAALAIGSVAAAVVGLGAVALGVTHHMMDLAQSIENTSAATGLTTTQVQEFNELAREMGVDAGSLEMAFARMEAQLGEFAVTGRAAGSGSQYLVKTFTEMGVAMQDASGQMRPPVAILSDFFDALQKIPGASTRTAIEMAALGSRGRVLAEVFEQARREGISLQDALKSIDASGAVLTPSELEDLERAKESWDKITRAIKGAGIQLGLFVSESVTSLKGFAAGAAAIGASFFGVNPAEFRKQIMAVLNPEEAKSGSAFRPFINPEDLGKLNEENAALQQRVAILRAGGEMQEQLNEAQAKYNQAILESGLAAEKSDIANVVLAQKAIGMYSEEISSLKQIIALQHQKADLSKLEAQLEAAEQAYTVAAVEGNKSLTAEKAKQIALYDREITSLQKSLGLTKELASLASVKPEFSPLRRPAPGPAPSAEEIALQNKYGEGLDINPSPSQQDLANYYGQRKYEKQFAGQEIPGISMAEAAPPMEDLTPLIGESTHRMLAESAEALDELRQKWVELAATADSPAIRKAALGENISMIQEQYQKDLQNFQLMFEMKKITAEQFAEAQAELADMTNRKLKAAYDEQVREFGTVSQRMRALLDEIAESGRNFSGKLFDSLGRTVDGIEGALAHLVVTGENSFRQLFQSLAEETLKNTFQLTFSKIAEAVEKHAQARQGQSGPGAPNPETAAGGIAGALGKVFGLGKKSDRILGTKENPMYVIDLALAPGANAMGTGEGIAGAAGTSLPALFKKIFAPESSGTAPSGSAAGTPDWMSALGIGGITDIAKPPSDMAPDSGGGSGASVFAHAGIGILDAIFRHKRGEDDQDQFETPGGGGGFFGGFLSMLSMFPKLASGGDVSPGKAYIVGENHPEFFVPRVSGHVAPSLKLGGDHTTHVEMHVHGVKDADSFRRSETQIYSNMHAQLAAARSRNG